MANVKNRSCPALSVIVPAHNAERTLARGVQSVMGAPFEIEVIIVENGSTDATLTVAEALQAEFPDRVRVIRSATGVCNARNAGMDAARGEWLSFIDADDWAEPAGLGKLMEYALETGAELAAGDISRVYTKSTEVRRLFPERKVWRGKEVLRFGNEILKAQTFMGNVWGKLFKRSWIDENRLRFDPSLSLAEDAEFMIRCALCATAVAYAPVHCYCFAFNAVSATRNFSESLPVAFTRALKTIGEDIQRAGEDGAFERYGSFVLYHLLLISVNYCFHPRNPRGIGEQLRSCRDLARSEPYATALRHVNYGDFSMTRKVPLFFITHRIYFGALLVARVRHAMFRLK